MLEIANAASSLDILEAMESIYLPKACQQPTPPQLPPRPPADQMRCAAQQILHSYPSQLLEKYSIHYLLGFGGFGFCVAVRKRNNSQLLCLKVISKSKISADRLMTHPTLGSCPVEVWALSSLSHPNIPAFIDYFTTDQHCYLIMETLAEQSRNVDLPSSPVHSVFDHFYAKPTTSDLFEYLQTQHISEPASRFIMLQLMSIVQYLDSRNMVHRDIKDENIIIDHRTLRILLVDFGSIVVFTRGEGIRSFLGTLQYAAPEVLASKKYDAQPAEVWQIGCLLYIMLSSRIPFSSSRQAQFEGMNRIETYVSAWALDLVESMLVKDPKRRATISDIINHPWMLG